MPSARAMALLPALLLQLPGAAAATRASPDGPRELLACLSGERLLELLARLLAAAALPFLDCVVECAQRLAASDDRGHAVESELVQLRTLGNVRRRVQRPAEVVDADLEDLVGHLLRRRDRVRRLRDEQCGQARHDVRQITTFADASLVEDRHAVGDLVVDTLDAIAEEKPLFAPERRSQIIQDAQQLLDALLVLADGGRDGRVAK